MDIQLLRSLNLPTMVALAVVALVGYVFGTLGRRRNASADEALLRLRKDLSRANMAVSELRKVIGTVSSRTAKHYSRLKKFQSRIAKLDSQQGDAIWQELCQEIERMLDPTFQLAAEIANAQERIRYQSNYLMNFSEIRTDPLTGLGNRRALDHVLSTQFDLLRRYGAPFSLAIVDIDHFKELNDQYGHQHGDQTLCDLAEILKSILRSVDVLARFGGDEFVIVMPQTDIAGAEILSERLRKTVEQQLPFTVSLGVAAANKTEAPDSLFHRTDASLYRAKSNGRNCIFCDYGKTTVAVQEEATEVC